jgi:hypothetical protein
MFSNWKIIVVCGLALAGCTSTPMLVASGGSRADATVEMSYEYSAFEVPEIDLAQGQVAAVERCKAWGYKSAEAFGGQTKQCQGFYNGACTGWVATVTYQCLG